MRTRYRVDGETIRFEGRDGRGSVLLELSRAGDAGLIVRAEERRPIGRYERFAPEAGQFWSIADADHLGRIAG